MALLMPMRGVAVMVVGRKPSSRTRRGERGRVTSSCFRRAGDAEGLAEAAGAGAEELGVGGGGRPRRRAMVSRPATGSRARKRTPPGWPSGWQETLRQ